MQKNLKNEAPRKLWEKGLFGQIRPLVILPFYDFDFLVILPFSKIFDHHSPLFELSDDDAHEEAYVDYVSKLYIIGYVRNVC